MADEAVVKIVIDDKGTGTTVPGTQSTSSSSQQLLSRQHQDELVRALKQGQASLWAPLHHAISAPSLRGLQSNQSEWLRMEAEAARRGMSVKDFKKAEIAGKIQPLSTSPSRPVVPSPSTPSLPFSPDDPGDAATMAGPMGAAPPRLPPRLPPAPPAPPPPPPPADPDDFHKAVVEGVAKGLVKGATEVRTSAPAQQGPDDDFYKSVVEGFAKGRSPFEPKAGEPIGEDPSGDFARMMAGKQSLDLELVAKRRTKAEEDRQKADAEYAKMKIPMALPLEPPFDPVALAKKRIKAEEQRAAVDAEYAKLKPKSGLDRFLEMAEDLRGTIGGTFGRTAGAALDITSRIREMGSKSATAGAASAEAGGMGAGMSSLASMAPMLGAVAVGAVAVIGAFKSLTDITNKLADRYEEYSPQIAQAKAQAEIAGMLGDMRRAQQSEKELVQFLQAQSELEQQWEDVKIAIMKEIIPVLTVFLRILSELLGIASRTDEYDKVNDPTSIILGRARDARGRPVNVEVPQV